MKNIQKGVGLMEILVALVLLAIAVLGFVALQIRAVDASHEATQNIQATNLATNLAERIRVNRTGLKDYKDVSAGTQIADCGTSDNINYCNAAQMAQYDYAQIKDQASLLGMQVAILKCQNITRDRQCIYISWGNTTPTNGNKDTDCTNGTRYVQNAKCVMMETYNAG